MYPAGFLDQFRGHQPITPAQARDVVARASSRFRGTGRSGPKRGSVAWGTRAARFRAARNLFGARAGIAAAAAPIGQAIGLGLKRAREYIGDVQNRRKVRHLVPWTPGRAESEAMPRSDGPFTGRFKKTKAPKPSKYCYYGYTHENEWSASIGAAEATWIGGTACRPDQLTRAITAAVLRDALRKLHKIEVTSEDHVFQGAALQEMFIHIGYQKYSAAATLVPDPHVYETGGNQTQVYSSCRFNISGNLAFRTMVEILQAKLLWFCLRRVKPIYIRISYQDNPINDNDYTGVMGIGQSLETAQYRYYINNLYVKAWSSAAVFLQNSTASDGGNTNADDIATNPLQYKFMTFKGLNPEWANPVREHATFDSKLFPLHGWQPMLLGGGLKKPEGIIWPHANGNAANTGFTADDFAPTFCKTLPEDSVFDNITGSVTGVLQPGEIKKYTCVYKTGGYVSDIFQKYAQVMQYAFIGTSFDEGPQGFKNAVYTERRPEWKSFMFVFEKMVHTGASSVVSINCDWEFKCGAKVMKRKRLPMVQSFANTANVDATDNRGIVNNAANGAGTVLVAYAPAQQ